MIHGGSRMLMRAAEVQTSSFLALSFSGGSLSTSTSGKRKVLKERGGENGEFLVCRVECPTKGNECSSRKRRQALAGYPFSLFGDRIRGKTLDKDGYGRCCSHVSCVRRLDLGYVSAEWPETEGPSGGACGSLGAAQQIFRETGGNCTPPSNSICLANVKRFRLQSQSTQGVELDLNGSAVVWQASRGSACRVAVDVDEVLGSFLATLNIFCAEEYASSHELSEFYVYDFRKIWKCSQAEANQRVHAFFESEIFHKGIPPIPGAGDALERLTQLCHLEVVTSRQHVIRQPTLDWIERHYPGIFKNVHFGNHFALQGEAKPKSEICKAVGAELLIDDNPKYAIECAEHGIRVLLFDWDLSYPWSKTDDGPVHPLITRVSNWDEVEAAILSHIQRTRI